MTALKTCAASGSPITPVEARNTSEVLQPTAAAANFAVIAQASRPLLPVKALALPELTTSARARRPFKRARHHSTGAEGHLERVNTPATLVSRSNTASITSVRSRYRTPAAAVARRTPAIAGRAGNVLGARGEMAGDIRSFRGAGEA